MCEVDDFRRSEVLETLRNRFVVVIGDSIQRNVYKDLVLLLQENRFLTECELKSKGEMSFLNDELIEGGRMDVMCNGIRYKEVRQYKTNVHLVRFYFVTRCYNEYVESILQDLRYSPRPDIIIMNSCLWDITRYGESSIVEYKVNLVKLFKRFRQTLPSNCLVIWNTALPISSSAKGGFLIPEIEFKSSKLRLDILEANFFAQKVASDYDFDVQDLHFYLRNHLYMRAGDGIHWDRDAHRTITHLLLSHIYEAWGLPLPKKRISFSSYGSTRARNWYNQQENINRQTDLQPLMISEHSLLDRPTPNSFSIAPTQNLFGNNGAPFQLTWQPYQQSSSVGAMPARTHNRYEPYRHRRP